MPDGSQNVGAISDVSITVWLAAMGRRVATVSACGMHMDELFVRTGEYKPDY